MPYVHGPLAFEYSEHVTRIAPRRICAHFRNQDRVFAVGSVAKSAVLDLTGTSREKWTWIGVAAGIGGLAATLLTDLHVEPDSGPNGSTRSGCGGGGVVALVRVEGDTGDLFAGWFRVEHLRRCRTLCLLHAQRFRWVHRLASGCRRGKCGCVDGIEGAFASIVDWGIQSPAGAGDGDHWSPRIPGADGDSVVDRYVCGAGVAQGVASIS